MTRDPQCHDANARVDLIAQTMRDSNVGAIPIVDEFRKLIGMVTDRDLAMKVIAAGKEPNSVRARDVMTPNPITCRRDDDVETVLEQMEDCQIRRVPVVDEENRLVGIIAQADIATKLEDPAFTGQIVREISK